MNLVDSCGWLEYVGGGPNAGYFAGVIEDTVNLLVPTVCIYEVCRRLMQQAGRRAALEVVAAMRQARIVPLSEALAIQAAALSLENKLPAADSIVLATARANEATLWTQDAHFAGIPGVKYREKP